MIGVLHAYSRTNRGDGLLVDLTLERLRRCGIMPGDVALVALDPGSFADLPHRVGVGTHRRGFGWELAPAAARSALLGSSALVRRPLGALAREIAACDALVAVGGGYLRAVDAVSSLGTGLNHLPQLLAASRARIPSLYLPQSIGPLRGPVGSAVRRALRGIGAVCVRDPWSECELGRLPNVRRVADLAVLDLAESFERVERVAPGGRVGFVARHVGHVGGYEDVVLAVARDVGDRAVWAVQTAGDRTKSDAVHYERLGVVPGDRLEKLLDARDLSLVVSVRLHGALMSLRAGVPAIHLAYDRKGPGAFADLGLDEWCFDLRAIDGDRLRDAIDELSTDPAPYWTLVEDRLPGLRDASERLDSLVRATLSA